MTTHRDDQPAAPPGRVLDFVPRKTAARPASDLDWDIDVLTLLGITIELAMQGINQEEMYLEDIEPSGAATAKMFSPTGDATPTLRYWQQTLKVRRINLEALSRVCALLGNPASDFRERLREIREEAAQRRQQIRDST